MVCPITFPMYYDRDSEPIENTAKTRTVYLPKGTDWYDFRTECRYEGGQTITSEAPIEIRVYSGKDAVYELYEDSGDGYRYESGEYAVTKMTWSEEKQKLEIAEPKGTYPGMIKDRVYEVRVVSVR